MLNSASVRSSIKIIRCDINSAKEMHWMSDLSFFDEKKPKNVGMSASECCKTNETDNVVRCA